MIRLPDGLGRGLLGPSLPLRLGARPVGRGDPVVVLGAISLPLSHLVSNRIEGCVILRSSLLPPSQKKEGGDRALRGSGAD